MEIRNSLGFVQMLERLRGNAAIDHYHWPTLRKEGKEESFPLSPLAASIWLKGLRAATDRNIKVKSNPTAQGQLFASEKGVRGRVFSQFCQSGVFLASSTMPSSKAKWMILFDAVLLALGLRTGYEFFLRY